MAIPVVPDLSTNAIIPSSQLSAWKTGLLFAMKPPKAIASRAAAQSIPTATVTAISFDTETFDNYAMFAPTSTNISCLETGSYSVKGGARWDVAGGGARMVLLYQQGTELLGGGNYAPGTAADIVRQNAAIDIAGANGDVITLQVFQTSGGALNASNARLGVSWDSAL